MDYISVLSNIKYNHTSNKIVEGPVDKETPRPAVMIIQEPYGPKNVTPITEYRQRLCY